MTKHLRPTWSQKKTFFLKCREMGVVGGLEDIKTISTWSVSALNLEKEPSYHTVRRILATENAIPSWMDSHGHERRKIWCNRSNASLFSCARMLMAQSSCLPEWSGKRVVRVASVALTRVSWDWSTTTKGKREWILRYSFDVRSALTAISHIHLAVRCYCLSTIVRRANQPRTYLNFVTFVLSSTYKYDFYSSVARPTGHSICQKTIIGTGCS